MLCQFFRLYVSWHHCLLYSVRVPVIFAFWRSEGGWLAVANHLMLQLLRRFHYFAILSVPPPYSSDVRFLIRCDLTVRISYTHETVRPRKNPRRYGRRSRVRLRQHTLKLERLYFDKRWWYDPPTEEPFYDAVQPPELSKKETLQRLNLLKDLLKSYKSSELHSGLMPRHLHLYI